jgi:voltage-gated potassium channel
MSKARTAPDRELEQERWELLQQLQNWLETPFLVLAFIWLGLFVVEMIWGVTPLLEMVSHVIWGAFIVEFVLGLLLAPAKLAFLRANWLKAIALALPALRVFRVVAVLRALRAARLARLASATRGLRLVRTLSVLNRGMRAFGASMGRRGFGYVVGLTLIVTFVGAAGMYAFENQNADGRGLSTYGAALWWTAMIMTTMGSEYWPQTAEGRVLCFVLSLYAFAVFGYVTATLATFFVGRDAENEAAELGRGKQIAALREEIAALRQDVQSLTERLAR